MTFEVGNHNSISLAQSNAGIVGRLWMNQLQHCIGGGDVEVDRKTMLTTCPKTYDQDCSIML